MEEDFEIELEFDGFREPKPTIFCAICAGTPVKNQGGVCYECIERRCFEK